MSNDISIEDIEKVLETVKEAYHKSRSFVVMTEEKGTSAILCHASSVWLTHALIRLKRKNPMEWEIAEKISAALEDLEDEEKEDEENE